MKSIHHVKVYSLLLFFTISFSFAQNDLINESIDRYTNVVPETPNAAAFVKYGNTPVSYEKGTPNISIPIYNINLDGVSIPISLSYDASGIRVDELATAVGLKWRLNAGGGIFRSVNNKPDEAGWTTSNGTSYDQNWYDNNQLGSFSTQNQLKSNSRDHAPDDFTYNIGGYFGSFIFKRIDINTIFKTKNDNLKITPILNNGLDQFEVKDVNGNTYILGNGLANKEFNKTTVVIGSNQNVSGNTDFYNSGWMVNEITTKNDKTINFEYTAYDMDYWIYGKSEKISRAYKCPDPMDDVCLDLCSKDQAGDYNDANYYYTKSNTAIRYQPKNKLISKIYTATEEVEFVYVDTTTTAIWDKKLDHIIIKDKIKNTTRSFHFVYDFYPGDARLRLKEVYEKGQNSETKPSYKFTYDGTHNLPAKNTYSRDFFGYYNGINNQSLIPFTGTGYAQLHMIPKDKLADRRPSFEHAMAGNLIKIEYPTGGVTKFEYELNQEQNDNGEDKRFTGTVSINSNDSNYFTQNGERVFQRYFTIPQNTLGVSGVNGTFQNAIRVNSNSNSILTDGNCNDGTFGGDIDCIKYYIYNAINQSQIGTMVGGARGLGYDGFIDLPVGSYFIVMNVDEDEYNQTNFEAHVNLKWIYRSSVNGEFIKEPHYAGGLRVKNIYDLEIDSLGQTKYNNTIFTYSGLIGQNALDSYYNQTRPVSGRTDFSSDFIGQRRFYPTGHYYESVLITKKDKSNNEIKILNKYVRDFENYSYSGKISKSYQYEGLNVVNKTFYDYNETFTQHDYFVLGQLDYCYNQNGQSGYNQLGYGPPEGSHYKEFESHLTKEINTEYFYDSQNVLSGKLTNRTNYAYNSDELIINKIVDHRYTEIQDLDHYDPNNYTFNSDADKITTYYKYPKNFLSESIFQDFVNNKNLLALPVRVYVTKNGNILDSKYLTYDTNGNIKELYSYNKGLGSNTSTFNYIPSDHDLDTEFKTNNGKLIEVSKPNGTIKSYIWDVTDTYLLAEITNKSHTSITSQIGINLSLTTAPDSVLRNEFNSLRTNNPDAMITSYTYRPLIGISSVTDPRGRTQFYEYDDLFRLKLVKDHDANILSENEYNYKN
jgi:hypothetical protein